MLAYRDVWVLGVWKREGEGWREVGWYGVGGERKRYQGVWKTRGVL